MRFCHVETESFEPNVNIGIWNVIIILILHLNVLDII